MRPATAAAGRAAGLGVRRPGAGHGAGALERFAGAIDRAALAALGEELEHHAQARAGDRRPIAAPTPTWTPPPSSPASAPCAASSPARRGPAPPRLPVGALRALGIDGRGADAGGHRRGQHPPRAPSSGSACWPPRPAASWRSGRALHAGRPAGHGVGTSLAAALLGELPRDGASHGQRVAAAPRRRRRATRGRHRLRPPLRRRPPVAARRAWRGGRRAAGRGRRSACWRWWPCCPTPTCSGAAARRGWPSPAHGAAASWPEAGCREPAGRRRWPALHAAVRGPPPLAGRERRPAGGDALRPPAARRGAGAGSP